MVGPEWTVAMDDALCERYPTCLECGRRAQRLDMAQVCGLVLALSRCARCFRQDPEGVQLIARLAQRA